MRFLFLTFLCISTFTLSASEVSPRKGRSGLDTLIDWYAYGTPINFAQLKGYWAGRCFMVNEKDKAVGTLLGYGSKNSRPGPIKMGAIPAPSNKTDYYDNPANLAAGKQDLADFLTKTWDHLTNVTDAPTANYSVDADANGVLDEKHEFVRYSSFVIHKWSALVAGNYDEVGPKNPGDLLGMCYYFRRVGN